MLNLLAKLFRVTRLAALLLTLLASLTLFYPAQVMAAGTNACSCTASACGNNAIGGDQGDVFTAVSDSDVRQYFATNPQTGWTCVEPAAVRDVGGPEACFCQGYCGNGGIGANPNFFDLGLSQGEVNDLYGGGKPGNRTGWLCGHYRGTFTGPLTDSIIKKINIIGGKFNVKVKGPVSPETTIRSAVVSLPEGVTGTIDQIVIIGPDGMREFGCPQNKVQNGVDLIKLCGGPAVLKTGDTLYIAQGSNFAPGDNIPFSVDLTTNFK